MRQILYGGLLILFMFVRPEGILGRARTASERLTSMADDGADPHGARRLQGVRRHAGGAGLHLRGGAAA